MISPPAVTYRFGDLELDAGRFELRRNGRVVDVQGKTLELLLYLVRHRDRVATRDELLGALWPDTIVSPASLSKAVSGARRAIGDDGARQGWIETVRGRGFRFVREVAEQSAGSGARSDDFVGREDVLGAVRHALEAVRAGDGRLVLLSGSAGIGKTRTAREALDLAREMGLDVARGWCPESGQTPALGPWRQVLRALDLEASLDRTETFEPAEDRLRICETVAAAFRERAAETALFVLIDDLHRSDSGSLALLEHLAHELQSSSIGVLVAFRDEPIGREHVLRALARRPESVSIDLEGLAHGEVGRLLANELGAEPTPELVSAIHRVSDGNPFFVKELARTVRVAPGGDGALEIDALPPAVAHLLGERVAGLDARARELLEWSAVLGPVLDVPLLSTLLEWTPDAVVDRLDALRPTHVVRREARGGTWRFAHELFREAILETLPPSRQAAQHRRIGEALEKRHADDLGPALFLIARHLCAGAPAGGGESAARSALAGAERARARASLEEAAELAARGLEALEFEVSPGSALELALHLVRGEALSALNERDDSRENLRRAIELARKHEDHDALARAAVAFGGTSLSIEVGVRDDDLVGVLEEALAAMPADRSPLRAKLVVRLAMARRWGGFEPAGGPWSEVVEIADSAEDPEARAHAFYGRHWMSASPEHLDSRLQDAEQLVRLASEAGHVELELAGHASCYVDLVELGRTPAARAALGRYQALAERLRLPRYRYRTLHYQALLRVLDGRFDEADALAAQLLETGSRIGARDVFATYGTASLVLRLERDDIRQILIVLDRLVEAMPSVPAWAMGAVLTRAELGEEAEARSMLESRLPDLPELASDFTRLPTLSLAGEAASLLGVEDAAGQVLDHLRPYAGRIMVFGAGVSCWGAVDSQLGRLALAAGLLDEAERHLEAAAALETLAGARPWLAWTRVSQAALLQRRGANPQAVRAAAAPALEVARELGQHRLLRRAASMGLD